MIDSFSAEERLVLLSADRASKEVGRTAYLAVLKSVKDWNQGLSLLSDRAAAALCLKHLRDWDLTGAVPAEVLSGLERIRLKVLSRNMLLMGHFQQIAAAFKARNIDLIPLKGIYLSDVLYGDLSLRQFSDLDLLVRPEQSDAALSCLHEMGYSHKGIPMSQFVAAHQDVVHFPPMSKQGVSVEIHIRLHQKSMPYQVHVPSLWEEAQPEKVHGASVLAFNTEDLLLHLCLHLDKHFESSKFQFTSYYDLVNMLNHRQVDWDRFQQKMRNAHAQGHVEKHLILVALYMGAALPEHLKLLWKNALQQGDIRCFSDMLHGRYQTNYLEMLRRSSRQFDRPTDWIRYWFGLFFPQKSFMFYRYRLTASHQLLWAYPKRLLGAIPALLRGLYRTLRY